MSANTEQRNFPKGSRLGPYEIASPLGAGGMGAVLRARDTRLNRDVAPKSNTQTRVLGVSAASVYPRRLP